MASFDELLDFDKVIDDIEAAFSWDQIPLHLRSYQVAVGLDEEHCACQLFQMPWRSLPNEILLKNEGCFVYLDDERLYYVFPAFLRAFVFFLRNAGSSWGGLQKQIHHALKWPGERPLSERFNQHQKNVILASLHAELKLMEWPWFNSTVDQESEARSLVNLLELAGWGLPPREPLGFAENG